MTFRSTLYSEWFPEPAIYTYPPAIARRTPSWITGDFSSALLELEEGEQVPANIRGIMREVYAAVQSGSRRLVAMGVRATIENVIVDKVEDQGSFDANVAAFTKAGYLSLHQKVSIETILGAGHAAIHRGWEPSKDDISTLLDITESIIEEVYLHPRRADRLDRRVPKRPPRPRGKT